MNDKGLRKSGLATVAALAALTALVLAGCAPFGTSRSERVQRFEADLNYSRAFAYENFLESATVDYATIRDELPSETWDLWFPLDYPEGGTYSISIDTVFADPITATIDGPDAFGGPKQLKLQLVRAGVIWYLEGLTLDGTAIVD